MVAILIFRAAPATVAAPLKVAARGHDLLHVGLATAKVLLDHVRVARLVASVAPVRLAAAPAHDLGIARAVALLHGVAEGVLEQAQGCSPAARGRHALHDRHAEDACDSQAAPRRRHAPLGPGQEPEKAALFGFSQVLGGGG
eukprot:scaffold106678_cov63-Phaeocystis_antarctica.AAC.1